MVAHPKLLQQILALVVQQLTRDFGRRRSSSTLTRMVKLYEVYPEQAIVATLSQVLSWSRFSALIPLREPPGAVAMASSSIHMSARIEHRRCSRSLLYPGYHMGRFGPLA
jgi:hypothetical protein